MNTKQTDKHILKNKAIWKSIYQEAYIAKKKRKKKKKEAKLWNKANYNKSTRKITMYILKTSGEQSSGPYTLKTRENSPVG